MGDKRAVTSPANGRLSGGPTTAEGKRAISTNRVVHGLRSSRVVVPGLEDPAQWAAHRDAILADLQPVGALELALALRVAETLWRLGRVVDAETAAVAAHRDEARRASAPDDLVARRHEAERRAKRAASRLAACEREIELLESLPTLPGDQAVEGSLVERVLANALFHIPERLRPREAFGWVDAGGLRRALAALAKAHGSTPEQARDSLLGLALRARSRARARHEALQGRLARLDRAARREVQRRADQRRLPATAMADQILRAEAHLSRLLDRTMALLRGQQALRLGPGAGSRVAVGVVVGPAVGDAPLGSNGRFAPAVEAVADVGCP
jgi:hypothetical protein